MGIINTTKRAAQFTALALVLAYGGFYAVTKWDTSKDRRVTIQVRSGRIQARSWGNVHSSINGLFRVSGGFDNKKDFEETFWARPGEKIKMWATLSQGRNWVSCAILFDGVPAVPPVTTGIDFEVSCTLEAVA